MIFLRHPTPAVEPGTCYGRTDLDIAEIAHQQIERALTLTPPVRKILASPALRCRKLALAIAKRDQIKIHFDERLWEMHMGEFEGKLWKDIDRSKSETWLKDPFNNKTPGGESFSDVQARVISALDHACMETAIICHAGVIRAIQMAWEGKNFTEVFKDMPPFAEPVRIWPPHLHDTSNPLPK